MSRSIVKSDIPWGGVLAYTRGQVIENDVVEEHGWQEYVVGENTKEARQIHADITGRPVDEPEQQTSRAAAKTSEQKG